MKAFLLTVAAFLACAGSMFAQNLPPEYSWEVGVNGGYSVMTRPLGPPDGYQGRRTKVVNDYSARLSYFATPNWMIHFDFGERRWESFGDWQLTSLFGKKLGTREVSFLVAEHALSSSVGASYVVPFYTRYNTFNRANLYFGAMLGMVTTTNDGSLGYSKFGEGPDSNYTYVSSYHYGYGIGYSFGLHTGFTYYIIPRLGVNIELGVRYANVKTNDEHYGGVNNNFRLLYFPETIGLRWRF